MYYIDFDDTLVNSSLTVLSILNERFNKNVKFEDCKEWYFGDKFPVDEAYVLGIYESDEFFKKLQFFPYAYEFLHKHNKLDNVIIVSKGTSLAHMKKQNFLNSKNIFNSRYIGVGQNESKSLVDMSKGIFIDDWAMNLKDSNAQSKILYGTNHLSYHNEGWSGSVIHSFKEVL